MSCFFLIVLRCCAVALCRLLRLCHILSRLAVAWNVLSSLCGVGTGFCQEALHVMGPSPFCAVIAQTVFLVISCLASPFLACLVSPLLCCFCCFCREKELSLLCPVWLAYPISVALSLPCLPSFEPPLPPPPPHNTHRYTHRYTHPHTYTNKRSAHKQPALC
jgi:hypothetical protein